MFTRLFASQVGALEIVIRGVLVYAFLLVLVRVSGKREIGKLSPMEFLSTLILSETVSPALTAQDTSFTASAIAATTLMLLAVIASLVTYRWRGAEKIIEGSAEIVIANGVVVRKVMRQQRITLQELRAALHREGVESEKDVRRAYVEASGEITVLK